MDVTAGLIVFSGLGAWLSARHRATIPAVAFTALATLLFCSTSVGSGWPAGAAAVVNWVAEIASFLAGSGGGE